VGDVAATPGNLLVQGDNLDALKALLPFHRGRVKCIFIDPPYNTRSAFEHDDDNLEHSQWLSMMLPRLQLLREFLREDGSIWVTIDDNEGHCLKVGQVWAARSDGRAVFAMLFKLERGMHLRQQINAALG
jgi:adenine-specific DNA-methyltransferase